MTNFKERFKEIIKRLSDEKIMTVSKLSRRSGISRKQIYNILEGEEPRLSTLRCLANALHISIKELIEDESIKERQHEPKASD